SYFILYVLVPNATYVFFQMAIFFFGYIPLLLITFEKLRYQNGLRRLSGVSISGVVKCAAILMCFGIPFILGLIFLRPIPFLVATIVSMAGVWLFKLILAQLEPRLGEGTYFAWK